MHDDKNKDNFSELRGPVCYTKTFMFIFFVQMDFYAFEKRKKMGEQ